MLNTSTSHWVWTCGCYCYWASSSTTLTYSHLPTLGCFWGFRIVVYGLSMLYMYLYDYHIILSYEFHVTYVRSGMGAHTIENGYLLL
jgi:hypothetical protein